VEGEILTAMEVIPKSESQQSIWEKYKKDVKYQWYVIDILLLLLFRLLVFFSCLPMLGVHEFPSNGHVTIICLELHRLLIPLFYNTHAEDVGCFLRMLDSLLSFFAYRSRIRLNA